MVSAELIDDEPSEKRPMKMLLPRALPPCKVAAMIKNAGWLDGIRLPTENTPAVSRKFNMNAWKL